MPRLFYCNTVYTCSPPSDINPLILQRYPTGTILALCARDGMVKRLRKLTSQPAYPYPHQTVMIYGWWEESEVGLLTKKDNSIDSLLFAQLDAVAILGRDRIHQSFMPLVQLVERHLHASNNSTAS